MDPPLPRLQKAPPTPAPSETLTAKRIDVMMCSPRARASGRQRQRLSLWRLPWSLGATAIPRPPPRWEWWAALSARLPSLTAPLPVAASARQLQRPRLPRFLCRPGPLCWQGWAAVAVGRQAQAPVAQPAGAGLPRLAELGYPATRWAQRSLLPQLALLGAVLAPMWCCSAPCCRPWAAAAAVGHPATRWAWHSLLPELAELGSARDQALGWAGGREPLGRLCRPCRPPCRRHRHCPRPGAARRRP